MSGPEPPEVTLFPFLEKKHKAPSDSSDQKEQKQEESESKISISRINEK